MSDSITHYWGDNAMSPCGRSVASVYSGVQGHGYSSSWTNVDCPACLASRKSRTSGSEGASK